MQWEFYDNDTFLESNDYNMNGHELCGNCAALIVDDEFCIYCTNDDSRVKMGQSSEKVGLCAVYQIETHNTHDRTDQNWSTDVRHQQ